MSTVEAVELALASSELSVQLRELKQTVRADVLEFRREIGIRLPSQLEHASSSEIRQHFGPFLEHVFRAWAERESEQVRVGLEAISRRFVTDSSQGAEPRNEAGARLARPSLEVSTFAIDASVVASLAIGVGALFANVAVGGLFLLAAPTLATLGREHGERAIRRRAAESAMKALEDAAFDLGKELERAIDDFARRIAPNG